MERLEKRRDNRLGLTLDDVWQHRFQLHKLNAFGEDLEIYNEMMGRFIRTFAADWQMQVPAANKT